MSKRLWIGTSWKINKTDSKADAFCAALAASDWSRRDDEAQLFVIPPFTVLDGVASALSGLRVRIGAQNAHLDGPPASATRAAACRRSAGAPRRRLQSGAK